MDDFLNKMVGEDAADDRPSRQLRSYDESCAREILRILGKNSIAEDVWRESKERGCKPTLDIINSTLQLPVALTVAERRVRVIDLFVKDNNDLIKEFEEARKLIVRDKRAKAVCFHGEIHFVIHEYTRARPLLDIGHPAILLPYKREQGELLIERRSDFFHYLIGV